MSELVTVEAYMMVGEADLAVAALERAGISAYVLDENIIAMDWLLASAIQGIKVQVARTDVEAAKAVLAELKRPRKAPVGTPEIVFGCESCGGELRFGAHRKGGVETCRHCGEYVDVPE